MVDTIFALASGLTPSGVAVIRLSGGSALEAVRVMAGSVPEPRIATLRTLRGPDGAVLDRGLVLCFPAPRSFTGEDCAELHLHGGRAVVAKTLEILMSLPSMRMAEPGEFTRRAFLNGKLDLVEVEALSDLIAAETEAQRQFAVENSGASQSALYASWRERLLHARAMIEAELDFADEGDVPGSVSDQVWSDMRRLTGEMAEHVAGFSKAEIIREGFRVVLAGPPNAGKSSLLNALAQRDVAIVSDEPGTTRDVLEVALDLGGIKVIVSDTAGLREDAAGVEAIGIARTLEQMRSADLVVAMRAYGEDPRAEPAIPEELTDTSAQTITRVTSKIDLAGKDAIGATGLLVSSKTGHGLPELLEFLRARAISAADRAGDILPSRLRHVESFRLAMGHLSDASNGAHALELRAEALRLADRAVGRVIGAADPEELLGAIFSQFCIGK